MSVHFCNILTYDDCLYQDQEYAISHAAGPPIMVDADGVTLVGSGPARIEEPGPRSGVVRVISEEETGGTWGSLRSPTGARFEPNHDNQDTLPG